MSKRGWLILIGLAVLLPALWLAGARFWARTRVRVAELRWAVASEPMEALLARHPPAAENAAARRVVELSGSLGIHRAVMGVKNEPRGPALGAIQAWVTDQAQKIDEVLEPPPAAVAAFLSDHRSEIQAIEAHVVGGGELAWEIGLTKGYAAPSPPLAVYRELNAVFLAHALESGRAGDAEASRIALEASWWLQQSLRERPELTSQLFVVIGARMQHGVLRRVPNPPRQWRERLVADYRKPMLRMFQLEAWTVTSELRGKGLQDVDVRPNGTPRRSGFLGWAARLVTSPYVELMSADYSNRLRVAVVELVSKDPCRLDPGVYDSRLDASIPRWDAIGPIVMPAPARLWVTLGQTGFDAELTEQVLEAKARRADGVPFLLAPRPSSVCASVRWVATAVENGVTIAPESEPFPAAAPYRNAKRFTVAAAAAR